MELIDGVQDRRAKLYCMWQILDETDALRGIVLIFIRFCMRLKPINVIASFRFCMRLN